MDKLVNQEVVFRGRIWLEVEGVKFLGPGRIELLVGIKENGSIAKAAKAMGMSYRKAWNLIDEMNTVCTQPVVLTQKGGQSGGGAQVTEAGKKLIAYYQALQQRLSDFLEREKKSLDW
jgi:molybdate transport system regulatory protein